MSEIAKIKIENEIMNKICNSLFETTRIHNFPFLEDKEIKKSIDEVILPIKPEIVDLFFDEYLKQFDLVGRTPYISLTSDNSSNELRVIIKSYNIDSKEIKNSDIKTITKYYCKSDNHYIFAN